METKLEHGSLHVVPLVEFFLRNSRVHLPYQRLLDIVPPEVYVSVFATLVGQLYTPSSLLDFLCYNLLACSGVCYEQLLSD